jgi:2-dehydropantoate 2-reductase
MKFAVVGAGAIGGLIGTRLAAAGAAEVRALARGATLAALRTHGWRLEGPTGALQAPVPASDDPSALGVQDLVVIAVKSQSLPALAPTLTPLLGPATMVLPAMNGVPWWFGQGVPGLDAMLGGGLPRGYSLLVAGPSETSLDVVPILAFAVARALVLTLPSCVAVEACAGPFFPWD